MVRVIELPYYIMGHWVLEISSEYHTLGGRINLGLGYPPDRFCTNIGRATKFETIPKLS